MIWSRSSNQSCQSYRSIQYNKVKHVLVVSALKANHGELGQWKTFVMPLKQIWPQFVLHNLCLCFAHVKIGETFVYLWESLDLWYLKSSFEWLKEQARFVLSSYRSQKYHIASKPRKRQNKNKYMTVALRKKVRRKHQKISPFPNQAVADLRGSKFFQLHAVFGKNLQNRMLAPPGGLTPHLRKSWIRHC